MTYEGIEPLEPETWLAQLAKLAQRPRDGEGLASCLRLAFHLAQLTPRPLRHLIPGAIGEQEFEALVEAGTYAEAALALLGEQMGYAVSRLPGATAVTAEVWFPGDAQGCPTNGPDAPSALLGAWLARLGSLDEPAPAPGASRPALHRGQSGPRPRSTEH